MRHVGPSILHAGCRSRGPLPAFRGQAVTREVNWQARSYPSPLTIGQARSYQARSSKGSDQCSGGSGKAANPLVPTIADQAPGSVKPCRLAQNDPFRATAGPAWGEHATAPGSAAVPCPREHRSCRPGAITCSGRPCVSVQLSCGRWRRVLTPRGNVPGRAQAVFRDLGHGGCEEAKMRYDA